MPIIEENLLQLGSVAVIFIFFIYMYFKGEKEKKGNSTERQLLEQVTAMNDNHLNTICENITEGNKEITKAITDMHLDLAKILGRIEGKLK